MIAPDANRAGPSQQRDHLHGPAHGTETVTRIAERDDQLDAAFAELGQRPFQWLDGLVDLGHDPDEHGWFRMG